MSSTPISQKRRRESSGSVTDEDDSNFRVTDSEIETRPKKRRAKRASRYQKQGRRIQHFTSSKKLESFNLGSDDTEDGNDDADDEVTNEEGSVSEYNPTSPARRSVSPPKDSTAIIPKSIRTRLPSSTDTTTSLLTTKLDTISAHINADNYAAAYKVLSSTTRTDTWQQTATLDSTVKIFNYTKLLGDGKKQGLAQAHTINDLRREKLELEEEVKELAKENARLRAE